jgi:hypothetical protein
VSDTTINVPAPLDAAPPGEVGLLATALEPIVHGLVGAYYGDLEVDVGKSVRWLEFYTDDVFITDINTGEQRYWVVNWAESFLYSEHVVTGRNFFLDNTNWRKEQFLAGDAAFHYNDADWCLFIDGTETISFDTRSLPTDYSTDPFMSWIWREVARAVGAGKDQVVLPFFAYLRNSDLQNIVYGTTANADNQVLGIPDVQQAIAVPWYLPNLGLPRLFKVSALRAPGFDWSKLDKFVAPDAGVKAQIVSYAYTHWQPLDVPAGQMTVPPIDATNDLGWKMRNLMSLLRPLPGLPTGTWQNPSTDPATSVPGPWCVDMVSAIDPSIVNTVEEDGHTAPNAAAAGVLTPLYDTVLRLNLRDGLWYQQGASGNIPLAWDEVNLTWVPRYSPEEWAKSGVGSSPEDEPPLSPMSVRLDGAANTYIRTADANYFDFQSALTILTVLRFDDWTPTSRKIIVSKWGAAGQRSWYWGIDPSGKLVFVISRDGTNSIEFVQAAPFGFTDTHSASIGVSLITHETDLTIPDTPAYVDRVRFWLYDNGVWVRTGNIVQQANPNDLKIFNSTAQVQIGAYLGTNGNAPSLYRSMSFRQGVADNPEEMGGEEVALMRGDVTSNPSFDRYGNLWTNVGGCTYTPMSDFDQIAHP